MTRLATITASLQDSIKMIKRLLGRIEDADRQARSYQDSSDYYYQCYRRNYRDYYYDYYQEYSAKASQARDAKSVLTTEAKAMMKNFKGSMERFEELAKGRDGNIKSLKQKVAEQTIILNQAATTQAISETNVLITYAKSNFALLDGVINSIRKSASKDEAMLLGALRSMNNATLKHTDRMLSVSENSIKTLMESADAKSDISDFNDSSVVSSLASVGESKATVFLDSIEGKSSDIVETALVLTAVGFGFGKLLNKMTSMMKGDENNEKTA